MRTIGLIGGMSWESTVSYYQAINRLVQARLGGLHSAKIVLESVDFAPIAQMQSHGEWDNAGQVLAESAARLQTAGADCVLICTNTMHNVAEQVENAIDVPLLHIADATAHALKTDLIGKVGLLGTRFTMEQDFYKGRLTEQHGIEVITPCDTSRTIVHDVIYNELCLGKIRDDSYQQYLKVIDELAQAGAQGVILGCTEIGLLVKPTDTAMPLYDTTAIHAKAAVDFVLSKP
ncbi:MAG: amino acid racemase [Alteromonadaceae bacterium]|nr:amino acid racemase [Alteromonadaceae bacterium]